MKELQNRISVIDPISPAIEKVNLTLFKPFDLGKWFVIGFCAWLANLAKGAGSPNFNFYSWRHQFDSQFDEVSQWTRDFASENLPWIIIGASIAVVMIITIWLVITWLSSRGRFMFLHCVAENKAEVKTPWTKFAGHANSLFLFRIVLSLIALVATGLLSLIAILLLLTLRSVTGSNILAIPGAILVVLVIIALAIAFLLAHKFTTDFVVPIMFLRTTSCVDAWRQFWALLSTNKAAFALYILFQIVIALAVGAIISAAVLMTCCCAGLILAIPYIGTVLMLPLLVFTRAYSLCFFRQFGPQFDVFVPEVITPVLVDGP